jgi:prepilin-type N-terminal cleavage/methylation domain-containing protein
MQNNTSRQGMTLIEVLIAMGIFTTVILWTLSTLMSSITTNRILTANAAANAVILEWREEIQEANAATPDDLVEYYALLNGGWNDSEIAVGKNGTAVKQVRWDEQNRGLVYTFAIPGPSETVSGGGTFNRGYGEILIYLNEASAPGAAGTGYDINGDKTIANVFDAGSSGTDVDAVLAAVKPLRLPIDITVKYFTDASHETPYFETTRRTIFTGNI